MAGAQEIQHILKIAAWKVPLFLTIASSLILSRLRPRYAKVFKFHWLQAHFENVEVTTNVALENS